MDKLFYDVPTGLVKTLGGYRMQYALFTDPFEAMSYASRMGFCLPGQGPLCVNRRPWHPETLERTPILDFR